MYADEMECRKNEGTTDSDVATIADWLLTIAAIGSAAMNAAKALELAQKEWDLAKRYWRLTQKWLDYYKDWYAPVEDQELYEARNQVLPEPIYETARGRARVTAWLQYRDVVRQAVKCTSKYCTGLRADMVAELAAAQADAVSMADGLGYRNERAYLESRDDMRFKRMLETAKRGRDMIADNVSLAKATANIYGDLYNQAWQGLTGAGQYLGYFLNRNDTHYPTEYLTARPQFQQRATGTGIVEDRSSPGSRALVTALAASVANGG